MAKLEEDFKLETTFKTQTYTLEIPVSSERFIAGKGKTNLRMEDHNVFHTLLNIIIKDAFRGTNLKQIGKAPKFFDM